MQKSRKRIQINQKYENSEHGKAKRKGQIGKPKVANSQQNKVLCCYDVTHKRVTNPFAHGVEKMVGGCKLLRQDLGERWRRRATVPAEPDPDPSQRLESAVKLEAVVAELQVLQACQPTEDGLSQMAEHPRLSPCHDPFTVARFATALFATALLAAALFAAALSTSASAAARATCRSHAVPTLANGSNSATAGNATGVLAAAAAAALGCHGSCCTRATTHPLAKPVRGQVQALELA
jgi:hypothetical protein